MMASRRSKKHGVTPGTIRGKDKNWLSEGMEERRYNYAMDTARSALGKTRQCSSCNGVSVCYKSGVTVGYGARSWWHCPECAHEYTKEISPEKMEQFYQEDLKKMLDKGKVPEVTA